MPVGSLLALANCQTSKHSRRFVFDCLFLLAPVIQDNPNGWGPCEIQPDQFKDMPYQSFSKSDRLGKMGRSDWTGAAFQDKKYASEYV